MKIYLLIPLMLSVFYLTPCFGQNKMVQTGNKKRLALNGAVAKTRIDTQNIDHIIIYCAGSFDADYITNSPIRETCKDHPVCKNYYCHHIAHGSSHLDSLKILMTQFSYLSKQTMPDDVRLTIYGYDKNGKQIRCISMEQCGRFYVVGDNLSSDNVSLFRFLQVRYDKNRE